MKKNKKYSPGKKCHWQGYDATIRSKPFTNKFGTFIKISLIEESCGTDTTDGSDPYALREYILRVPLEQLEV